MIEPNDEMMRAFEDACGETYDVHDGLAAVLAIVERDYRIEPRPPWEKAPHCPVVNDHCPGNANGWICDEPCDPDGTP